MTTIDGDDIVRATIDGDSSEVKEVTMDGDVVFVKPSITTNQTVKVTDSEIDVEWHVDTGTVSELTIRVLYRVDGTSSWTQEETISPTSDGYYTGRIDGLDSETTYEVAGDLWNADNTRWIDSDSPYTTETTESSVTWIDDFTHGSVSNYGGSILYGSPESSFSITTSGSATNESGYAMELAAMETRGGVTTMPSENLIPYYPDVGDNFRYRGYVSDFNTGDGSDHIFMAFGLNSSGDDSNCIFVRFQGNGRKIDLMEGWGGTIDSQEVWSSGNEPSGQEFWFDIDWNSGSVSADFHTASGGHEASLSGSYSNSKGRGVAWGGDEGGWQARQLGAKML